MTRRWPLGPSDDEADTTDDALESSWDEMDEDGVEGSWESLEEGDTKED